ncbi:MAG: ribonuclease HI family protein [Patescibacteria group bacterium]|nr:ribonuclease HI family protein [Patescibacteria group bacterium]
MRIWTDGGARGNPGPAAIGVYIEDEKGEALLKHGKKIGYATNNVAEYQAVIEALTWLKESSLELSQVDFFLDSSLVVNQLNGVFRIKENHLRDLINISTN